MVRQRLLAGLATVLLVLPAACSRSGPLDLPGLEGRARAGDAAAFRELVGLLAVSKGGVNDRSYRILVDLGPASIPHLLEKIDTPDRIRREYLIAALGTLKAKEAVPAIGRVLADRNRQRRYIAAWALGEIGDPGGVPPLIDALEDPEEQVRRFATRSLIKLNRLAVPGLLACLEEASPGGEAAAVRALGDIGDPSALEPLLNRADGPNRAEVLLALGKLKDPRAEAALIRGLADADWTVRMNAAMALGPLGSAAAVPHLEKTLEDEVMVVREWSARSLEMITGRHFTYRNASGEYVPPYAIYH